MTEIREIGERINDRYQVEELLGAGGMGCVYRAFDSVLGHQVALKFAANGEGSKDRTTNLMREFEILRALDHFSIPKAFDYGETEDGDHFISLEYVPGETLKSLIESGSLPAMDQRIGWLKDLASVLVHVHERGFVYCDLKPENVLICRDDTHGVSVSLKLIDFGVAVKAGDQGIVGRIDAIGTTAYMSPEQHRKKAVDFRSDVYSFGVLGFEVTTGRRPFEVKESNSELSETVKSIKLTYMHLGGKAACPQKINPEVPADLSWFLEVCLQKNPNDRFSSMTDVLRCLEAVDGSGLFMHFIKDLWSRIFRGKTKSQVATV